MLAVRKLERSLIVHGPGLGNCHDWTSVVLNSCMYYRCCEKLDNNKIYILQVWLYIYDFQWFALLLCRCAKFDPCNSVWFIWTSCWWLPHCRPADRFSLGFLSIELLSSQLHTLCYNHNNVMESHWHRTLLLLQGQSLSIGELQM